MQVRGLHQDLSLLWALFDRIASKRVGVLNRSGIVHTISHSRKDDLYDRSRFRDRMIINPKGEPPTEDVERFKRLAGQGAILVSPSVGTGYDFNDDTCRWQFVVKVPFEPPSKILKARQEEDKEYVYYRAMQYLVQAFGRDVRSKTDWSERFIGDEQMSWFKPNYSHLAPKSFHALYRRAEVLPQPLML